MEVKVEYLGGVQFGVEARGHYLVCDQPAANGGEDGGMTPPELLLASLAACAGFYAAQYLNARSLDAAGLAVRVEAEKAMQPARLGAFRVIVETPPVSDPRHKEGVLRAVKSCLIHNTLLHAPALEVELVENQVPVSV